MATGIKREAASAVIVQLVFASAWLFLLTGAAWADGEYRCRIDQISGVNQQGKLEPANVDVALSNGREFIVNVRTGMVTGAANNTRAANRRMISDGGYNRELRFYWETVGRGLNDEPARAPNLLSIFQSTEAESKPFLYVTTLVVMNGLCQPAG